MSRTFEVKVIPRAKRNEVVLRNGQLVVRVTAPANDGKANRAVIQLLAEYWKLPKSRITIVRGTNSRTKIVERLDPVRAGKNR